MSTSRHVVSLIDTAPSIAVDGSSITTLSAANFPLLKGISLIRTVLASGVTREPHWHAEGNQLAYCLSGTALVTLFLNGSNQERFVRPGRRPDVFVPSGAMQAIENIGTAVVEVISALTTDQPKTFGLSGSLAVRSDAVIGNAFGLPAAEFAGRSHSGPDQVFSRPAVRATVTDEDRSLSPYTFDIEAMSAPVDSVSGWAKTARAQFWPILQGVAFYSVTVNDNGMREPRWHPMTGETGYAAEGSARMTVLDPDGTSDTYLLEQGDAYFIPRAHPHHIEDIGDGPTHFCIFSDNATPGDIGYRAALTHLRRELLATAFGLEPEAMPALPFTASDPLIVARVNPVDLVST